MIPASFIHMLAAVDPSLPALPTGLDRATQKALGGTSAVVISVIFVIVLMLVWAVFIRKPQGTGERGTLTDASPKSSDGSGRRRRRKQSRHRNPTLAETGGLPPLGSGTAGDSNLPRT